MNEKGDDLKVGLKIKEYLNENGISQSFISRKTKISPTKINLSLNGNRRFTFEEYALICGILDLNTDYFLKPRIPQDKDAS